MKATLKSIRAEKGNTLVIAVLLTGILSFTIAGYLAYSSQRNAMIGRSQFWNECIPIAEAGVEDSLMNLGRNGISNLTQGGWSYATNSYYIDRYLDTNNTTFYHAVITGNNQTITNTVEGRLYLPGYMGGSYLSRTIQVVATNAPLFSYGLVGTDTIDFNNKNVSLGCGSSGLTSNGGLLDLNIAASLSLLNILNICLQGSVALGPNGLAVGANADITGLINASATTDLNVQFNSVTAPNMSAVPPMANVRIGLQLYTYVASGDTSMSSLNLTGNQTMLISADTRLYVSGNVNVQNNASIYIAPGATLQLYVGGTSSTFGGQGVVVGDQNPLHFQYFGLDANTSVTFNGPSSVQGLVYAPQAQVSLATTVATGGILGIGATLTLTFNGAVIGHDVSFATDTVYNYYQPVVTNGPSRGFVVASWKEL